MSTNNVPQHAIALPEKAPLENLSPQGYVNTVVCTLLFQPCTEITVYAI
jgi:hypothetical protein